MDEKYLGEIIYVAYNFAPRNTIWADGRTLPVQQYTALFSLLGTMFGGNGQTNFALPDLRKFKSPGVEYQVGDKLPDGTQYCKAVIAYNGIYPSRD
jgi:microcystin-dependent protein